MELSEQCISLELAKRLKELKVIQESLYYWKGEVEPSLIHTHAISWVDDRTFSAFTVAELGAILPINIKIKGYKKLLTIKHGFNWHINYEEINFQDLNEANARAKCLIMLIENGLMKTPK